jgi:hypothetical protein
VSARSRLLLGLVLYGLLVSAYGIHYWDHQLPTADVALMQFRQTGITASISVLDQGGPPLVESGGPPYRQAVRDGQMFPADSTDDPGIYLYLPVAGYILGEHNPVVLLKWFSILGMGLALLSYPIVFYLLFDSLVVALLAPLVLVADSGFLFNSDVYFIQAWGIVVLLPFVLAVAKLRWRRGWSLATLAAATIAASFASSVRSQAGLGIALAALAVAVARERGFRWRALGAGVVVVAYLLVSPLGIDAVRNYSQSLAHVPQSARTPPGHPFWGNVYIGLGVVPNPWGIQWHDQSAQQAVAKVDPTAKSIPAQQRILRHLYLQIVFHHPLEVLRIYSIKAAVAFQRVWSHFWLPLLLAPLVLVAGRRRRRFRAEFALTAPSLLLGLAPPVLTVPHAYDAGFVGAVAFLALLSVIGVYLIVRDAVTARVARTDDATPSGRASPRSAAIAVGATVAMLAVGLAAGRVQRAESSVLVNQFAAALLQDPPRFASVVDRWAAPDIARWETPNPATVSLVSRDSVFVTSTPSTGTVELWSQPMKLAAGTYDLAARGLIDKGGMQLGVISEDGSTWFSSAGFWSKQVGFESKEMVDSFVLKKPTTLRIALADWGDHPATPRWFIRSIRLGRPAS